KEKSASFIAGDGDDADPHRRGDAQSAVPRLPLVPDSIPKALKSIPRWVIWKAEERDGRLTKVPYRAKNPSVLASTMFPLTWAGFRTAKAAYSKGDADGIGIVVGEGLVGIDIDGCRDAATGVITAEAATIVEQLQSYTEIT